MLLLQAIQFNSMQFKMSRLLAKVHLDKSLAFALLRIPHGASVMAAEFLDPVPGVHDRLRGGYHVEGHGHCVTLVDVVHPEPRSGELPLHVAISLSSRD